MSSRVAVFISGTGSNLQAIIDKVKEGLLPIDLCLVVSDKPQALGIERAQRAGIVTKVLKPYEGESRLSYDKRLLAILAPFKIDLIALSGFMRILSPQFVRVYEGKIINIHPSLLPKYPGLDTHRRVLEAGDTVHGVTIHRVIAALDAGEILAQKKCAVQRLDDENRLKQRVHALEHDLYWRVIKQLTS